MSQSLEMSQSTNIGGLSGMQNLSTALPTKSPMPQFCPPPPPPFPLNDDEHIMEFILGHWKLLHDQGRISNLLYPSTIVDAIAIKVISTWLKMEEYNFIPGQNYPTSSGGNVLVTGTKGVGKTTLLKGLQAIINSHSGRIKAVYRNFEEVNSLISPSEDLGFDQHTSFTTDTYEAWCKEKKKCLIFFGDEFDFLYENGSREKSTDIAKELLSLGKSSLGFGVLSGSSSWFKSLAFKEDVNDEKHRSFPNMNCTVYVEYRMSPVRDVEQLKQVLILRNRHELIDQVNEVFCKTGGMGRMIDALSDLSTFQYSSLPSKIENFVDDPRYGTLIRRLYVANYDDCENVNYFQQKGLTAAQLRLLDIGCNSIVKELMNYHILHLNDSRVNIYEFLYPYHMVRLRDIYVNVSSLESLAMETTLKGWQGFESAGQILEPLIIRTLVQKRKGPFSNISFSYDNWEWHYSFSPCKLMSGKNSLNCTLDILYGKVCIPIPDNGLDSFVLTRGQGDSVHVQVTHIKCGECGKKITSGSAKSEDASRFFTAILKVANTGWACLLAALQSSFSDKQFFLTSFSLVTNKEVAEDIRNLESVQFNGSPVHFMVYANEDFDADFEDVLKLFNLKPPHSS